MYPL
jgi:hypothetical protein